MPSILENTLGENLLEEPRITVQKIYEVVRGDLPSRAERLERSKTPGPAKSLLEFYNLVNQSIQDYEKRTKVPKRHKVLFTEEEPDIKAETEIITFSLISREPGAYQRGSPLEAKIKNLRPMLREEKDDQENPGYRHAINGYWYDNIVRFTCWAKTNKIVNQRAMWFEDLMEEYTWWFKLKGVDRVIFLKRNTDLVVEVQDIKWYGRPIDYFVRTEKIRVFSEKKLEEILINLMVKNQ